MVNIQCKYNDNFPNAQIATIGDINFGKYPHFAIVGFEIMPHLCSVENRSCLDGLDGAKRSAHHTVNLYKSF